jgi:tetratricopeptide (TPR) repeat protein
MEPRLMKTFKLSLTLLASLALLFGLRISHGQNNPDPPSVQRPVPSAPSAPKGKSKLIDPIAKGHLDLGKAYFYAENWDASIANFRKAIERDSGLGEAHLFLGEALYRKKSYDEAVQSIKRALLDPDLSRQADTYKLLGAIYEDQKYYRDAEANYKKAFALDSRDPEKHNSLAYIYALQRKNLEEALTLVNYAINSTSDEFFLFHYFDTRAWVYYQLGSYAEAEKDALKSARLAPKLLATGLMPAGADQLKILYYHLGEIYLRLNKPDLARREFDNALRIDKNYNEALEGSRKVR